MARINVRELQTPISEHYKKDPQSGQIRLEVRSFQADLSDPLHCAAQPVSTPDTNWRSGAHPAVGGTGDVPCSGDLLLGALAACQETTIRMVAANMGSSSPRSKSRSKPTGTRAAPWPWATTRSG